jgi:hypothetical protein
MPQPTQALPEGAGGHVGVCLTCPDPRCAGRSDPLIHARQARDERIMAANRHAWRGGEFVATRPFTHVVAGNSRVHPAGPVDRWEAIHLIEADYPVEPVIAAAL